MKNAQLCRVPAILRDSLEIASETEILIEISLGTLRWLWSRRRATGARNALGTWVVNFVWQGPWRIVIPNVLITSNYCLIHP